jgi:glycosyltransferase involved in cell wall biosynthesis
MSDGDAGSCAPRASESCVVKHSISAFFPAFNDAPSLPKLIGRTFEVLARCTTDYEVIVVNDGSSDETGHVLLKLAEEYAPRLRIVTHPRNLGYGAALRSGFSAARKEWIFYTDGDGQYDPAELELLLETADDGTALINGFKIERHDPPHRVAIGWLYNRFARALFRIRIRDLDCDFRLVQARFLDRSRLQSTSGTICVEIVRTLELSGGRIAEVPVHHYPRLHGRSQFFRLQSLASTLLQLCSLFVRLVAAPGIKRAARSSWSAATFRAAAFGAAIALCLLACGRAL